jgi:hypothetical protein
MKTTKARSHLQGKLRIFIVLGESLPLRIVGYDPISKGNPQGLGHGEYRSVNIDKPMFHGYPLFEEEGGQREGSYFSPSVKVFQSGRKLSI